MRNAKKYLVGATTAAMVLGTLATGAGVSAASAGSSPFSDIAGNSEGPAITFLSSIGVVNGVGGGMYDPSAPVTREEMAKIVVNLIGKGNVAAALQNETPSFTDASSIDTWAWGYVNVAADMGIINGFPDGSFQPQAPVTDVQAAAMLVRAIGDQNQVMGSWPGNYVTTAFSLGINTGVDFVANLPATRGDVAQMAYEAAVNAPVYAATTVNGVTSFSKGEALYQSGAINGNQVYTGTVTGVSTGSVTWMNGSTSTTKNFESSYQLVGVTNVSDLVGQGAVINVDSNGNVNYIELAPGESAQSQTGTLATSSTTVPSGFYQFNNGSYPWLLTNNYTCSTQGAGGASCGGTYYLLLGGTTPTTVELSTYNSQGSGTTYSVNVPSTGLNTDPVASVPDYTYLGSGDTVSYILNSSNVITSINETNVTDQIGLVTSTTCPSGCDNTPANAGVPQNTLTLAIGSSSYTVNLQSYTTLTLNGAAATLSKSLDNDVVYVNVVGNDWNHGQTGADPNNGNATVIAAYNNQVSGTVTAVTTSNGATTSFTLSLSNGSSQNYTADGNFSGSADLNPGATVTVALDSAGEARAVLSTNVSSSPTVAIVTGTGSSTTLGSGTSVTVTLNDGAQTLDVPAAATTTNSSNQTLYSGTVFNTTYKNGSGNGNNGAILYVTNATGNAVTPGTTSGAPLAMSVVTPAQAFNIASNNSSYNDTWEIVSASSSSVVLGAYITTTSGTTTTTTLDTSVNGGNPYISIVVGGAFKGSDGASLGFGGVDTGHAATLYVAPYSSQNYYAVIDQGQ